MDYYRESNEITDFINISYVQNYANDMLRRCRAEKSSKDIRKRKIETCNDIYEKAFVIFLDTTYRDHNIDKIQFITYFAGNLESIFLSLTIQTQERRVRQLPSHTYLFQRPLSVLQQYLCETLLRCL